MMKFTDIQEFVEGRFNIAFTEMPVLRIHTDSRKALVSKGSLFFALPGLHNNGVDYIPELLEKGVQQFILPAESNFQFPNSVNVARVPSVMGALQAVAQRHRQEFEIPILGITGSNGKTIVKEWISNILANHFKVARSPGSYNSQIGVPHSVWRLNPADEFGVFEAGISLPGEMEKLEKIISPTVGLFTNIGPAHNQGFASKSQKIKEKLKLFINSKTLVYCSDYEEIASEARKSFQGEHISWSEESAQATYRVKYLFNGISFDNGDTVEMYHTDFKSRAALENLTHTIVCLKHNGLSQIQIQEGIRELSSVSMRLELKKGHGHSYIIDDSYNNDLNGLEVALDFMKQQSSGLDRYIVLSDMLQTGLDPQLLYETIAGLLRQNQIKVVIGIGPGISKHSSCFSGFISSFYADTDTFLENINLNDWSDRFVLVKGARPFEFERIVERLQQRTHQTVLEISLESITQNLNHYRSLLSEKTKVMAMVKASAYGSGRHEIASLLQFHNVDYLGVAYPDEGILLRSKGISIPIMVMNSPNDSLARIIAHDLEPAIYNLRQLQRLEELAESEGRKIGVHIKIDTGMHRLGFSADYVKMLSRSISKSSNIVVLSVFTHLAAADENAHDDFTKSQIHKFVESYEQIAASCNETPMRHVLNTAGIERFPQYQFEMVRLGIGLYGINPVNQSATPLTNVFTFRTTISQIRQVGENESIGYARKGQTDKITEVATVPVGYADGFPRKLGNGNGFMLVNGKKAPVIGNVCMDMTMIDVTNLAANEGDDVEIFGSQLNVTEVANSLETIPYEVLTGIGPRVRRIFHS